MAYSVKTLLMAGALAAAALPSMAAASDAPNYGTATPVGMNMALPQQLSQLGQLTNMANLNGLTNLANMDIGQMIQQAVVNAVVTQVTSKIFGEIPGLSDMANAMAMGGMMNGGLTGGVTSGFASSGLTSNFGGLGQSFVTAAVNAAAQQGVAAIIGGIQGSGSSGGSSIGDTPYVDTTATQTVAYAATTTPALATSGVIDTGSMNYVYGNSDGGSCLSPDPRFLMSSGTYDSNYWNGYNAAIASCTSIRS